MALTVAASGGGTSVTDDTTLPISVGAAGFSIGDVMVIAIAAANSGTNGVARTVTIADNASGTTNVYSQRGPTGNQTAGTASAGASQFWFECPITTALTSTEVVTITFSGNLSEKAASSIRLQPAASESVIYSAVGTASVGAGATTHDAATVSVADTYTIFAAAAIETDDATTGDSDTTNGSWSAAFGGLADSGTDPNAMRLFGQWKTATATGDQAWACTTASGRDSARNYIIYYSGTPPAAGALNTMIRSNCVIAVP